MKLAMTQDDMRYFREGSRTWDPKIQERIVMERAVVRHAVKEIFAYGPDYLVRVHNGDDFACTHTRDLRVVMEAIMQTDEEHIYVYKKTGALAKRGFPLTKIGWMFLVYGNAGWEVICDHTLTLGEMLRETDKYTDKLAGEAT